MSAEEERWVFIINVCLSCLVLPAQLFMLALLSAAGSNTSLQSQEPDFPWCFSASWLRKYIVNSPRQIRRKYQGRKDSYYSQRWPGMLLIPLMVSYGILFNDVSNHRSSMSHRTDIRTGKKRNKEWAASILHMSLGSYYVPSRALGQRARKTQQPSAKHVWRGEWWCRKDVTNRIMWITATCLWLLCPCFPTAPKLQGRESKTSPPRATEVPV